MLGFHPLASEALADDISAVVSSAVTANVTGVSATGSVNAVTENHESAPTLASVSAGIGQHATVTLTITVANSGSGNKFYVNGVEAPTLTLTRNTTYVFDVSDSSNSGHPLRFKDGSGNSYSTGVSTSGTEGSANATVTLAVASNAPDSLRYYCTVHGNGMGNTISVGDGTTATSEVNITATGVSATSSAGTLTLNADANHTLSGVSTTSSIGTLTIEATAVQVLTGAASATSSAGTVTGKGEANQTTASVSATTSVGTTTSEGEASHTLASASANASSGGLLLETDNNVAIVSGAAGGATGSAGTITPTADANKTITGVDSSTAIDDVSTTAGANVTPSAVTGTVQTQQLTFNAAANNTLSGTSSSVFINNSLDIQAKSNITIGSVTVSGSVGNLEADIGLTARLDGVFGALIANAPSATGVTFNFESFADVYSRDRMVTILPHGSSFGVPDTVFIPAENFTVYLEPYRAESNTVFITN